MKLMLLFLYSLLWVTTLIQYFFPIIDILHIIIYESILILLISVSMQHKLSFIMAISVFIYFYQAPLLNYLPHIKLGLYEYNLNKGMIFEAQSIYNLVIGCLIVIIFKLRKINIDLLLGNIRSKTIIKYIYQVSFFVSILLIFYALNNAGGLSQYLTLNKFESSSIQKIGLFTYKDFAMITIVSGLLYYKSKFNLILTIFIISIIVLEILSAKRFMIMYTFVSILIIYLDKMKLKYIIGIIFGIFFMTLLKFIYYNVRNYILGMGTFSDIFWFDWSDVLRDILFMHEGRGHIELLLNYLYHNITFEPSYFGEQLFVSMPLGHKIITDYLSAGEYLRLYLHEPWSGLASSQYIVPYLSIGFIGIILVYSLIYFIITVFIYILKRNNNPYISIFFFINLPVIIFYEHREEIIVIVKNLIISSIVLLSIYMVSMIYKNIKNNVKKF